MTWLPPQLFVTVSVPVAGGAGTVTVPVSVYKPPAQAPGTAVMILQFVVPAPGTLAFVCVKLIIPAWLEKLVINIIYH